MPVIEISLSDLQRLLGAQLAIHDIYRYMAKLKCEIEEIRGETIVFEANSDRPDLFSVEGVARALRPWFNLRNPDYKIAESAIRGFAETIAQRPYVALAVVKDVELDNEAIRQMMQLQEKIAETYGRKRRKVSIGVYDLDFLKPPIYYKLADPDNTRYRPLDEEKEMTLREVLDKTEKGRTYGYIIRDMPKYPVLIDSENRVLSLVPILNSDECKVTARTRNILIDATGTSLHEVLNAVTVMAYNIAERSRSRVVEVVTVNYDSGFVARAPRVEGEKVEVDVEKVYNLLGVHLGVDEIANLLGKFYYEILSRVDKTLIVRPPAYRIDVKTWVDVAEDIAIAYGYERLGLEAASLPESRSIGRISPVEYVSRQVRDILIGLGFTEIANYMMTSRYSQLELLGLHDKEVFIVENPRSERFEAIRRWFAPQLLEVIVENTGKYSKMMIFEIGDVVEPDVNMETGALVERRVGIAITHEKATLTDGLAYVKALMRELDIGCVFEKGSVKGFIPERTALVKACGVELGYVGEVDPVVLYRLGLKNPVVIAEISISKIISACMQGTT